MTIDASPLATGGSGVDFETEVGALYLATLLVEGPVRGAAGGRVLEASFQQPHSSSPLDDMVLETEGRSGRARFDLQLKRTLAFRQGDREFGTVLKALWETSLKPEFQVDGARFGVAVANLPPKAKEHYLRVPEWARTSTSASHFLGRIAKPGYAHEAMREFVQWTREGLEQEVSGSLPEEALWKFFRRLVLLEFDVHLEISRDRDAAIDMLRAAVPTGDLDQARRLFDRLRQLVRAAATTGGGYTAVSLREKLIDAGMELSQPVPLGAAIDKLTEHTDRVLGDIESELGDIVLDRGEVAESALGHVNRGGFLVLTGTGGVGKSAVLKMVGAVRRQDGLVLALSSERLRGVVGWEGLASRLSIDDSLTELALGLSGCGRPTLLVDGVDRIEEDGARLALNDLIRALTRVPVAPGGVPRWSIAVTARSHSLAGVWEWIVLEPDTAQTLTVPELNELDVSVLRSDLPHLTSVLDRPDLGPLVRNLYFLRVLERARKADPTLTVATSVTESEVQRIWWERIVGQGGKAGRVRQAAMLALGESALRARSRQLTVAGLDVEAAHRLEQDGVLRRDPNTDTYWFGHDIVEEWAAARVLRQHRSDLADFLRSLGEPFWAFRALQLTACAILESEDGGEHWEALLKAVEGDVALDGRWVEAILTAPLRSSRVARLLPLVEECLWADVTRQRVFLRSLRTRWTQPNPAVEDLRQVLGTQGLSSEEAATLQSELAWPDPFVWMPVLAWMVPSIEKFAGGTRGDLSRIFQSWQRSTPPGAPYRREIAETAFEWWSVLKQPSETPVIVSSEAQPHYDRLRDIVAMSADAIPELIPRFLTDLRRVEQDYRLAQWIAGTPHASMAQHTPGPLVDFVLDVLVPEWRPAEGGQETQARPSKRPPRDDAERALENFAFLSPSHLRGPFLLLLHAHRQEGLRLIHTLVNVRTDQWMRRNGQDRGDLRLTWKFGDEASREFRGYAEVYSWFRPNAGAPNAVTSALMALEVWMEQRIEEGEHPEALFAEVVAGSTSAGVVGICMGIALAFPDRCLPAAVPFVCSPLIWEYDISRASLDSSPTFSFAGLFGSDPLEAATRKRDERPQRGQDVRSLVWRYLFHRDGEPFREVVGNAIQAFPEDLSVLSPGEKSDAEALKYHRERMENFVPWADPKNYVFYQNPDGSLAAIQYNPPEEIRARNAPALERLGRHTSYWKLKIWSSQALKDGHTPQDLTVPQALELARQLQREGDFTSPLEMDAGFEHDRILAIAGVAEAVVRVAPDELNDEVVFSWCRDTLMAASDTPSPDGGWAGDHFGEKVLISAARGLMGLILQGRSDEESRLAAWRLLRRSPEIADAVMEGVLQAWGIDEVFCRNAVARELELATEPLEEYGSRREEREAARAKAGAWREAVERRFERRVSEGRLPPKIVLAALTDAVVFRTQHVERALNALQDEMLDEEWVWDITEVLLRQAFKQSSAGRQGGRSGLDYAGSQFLGDWLARLTGLLTRPELETKILSELREHWPATAGLLSDFMYGFTARHLAQDEMPETVRGKWESITASVITAEPLDPGASRFPSLAGRLLSQDEQAALGLAIHVRDGRAVLTEAWTAAPSFIEIYEAWVSVAGHTAWGLRTLVTFAGAAGSTLPPDQIIKWLHTAVHGIADRESLWDEGGLGQAAAELMWRLWERSRSSIRTDSEVLGNLAALVDELTRAGVPLAARIRREMT